MDAAALASLDADLEHAPCGILSFGPDLVLLAVNQTLADMLGRSQAELLGRSLDRLLTPSQRLVFHMQAINLLHLHGHFEEIGMTLAGADGVEIPVLCNAVRRQIDGVTVTQCVLFRVSERRRLEDELFRVRKAAEQMPGLVYQYLLRADGSSCFPYASEGMRAIYELSPQQVQHSAELVFGRIHPDDLRRVGEGIALSARTRQAWRDEYRVNLPVRGLRWLEGHAQPEARADGSVLWHGYISDVTGRKALQAALANEHERTQVTLRSIGDAVIVTNEREQVEYLNPVAQALTGWSQAEAVGQPLVSVFNIVNQHTRLQADNPVARCLAECAIVGLARDTVLVARDGSEYAVEDSAAPIAGPDGSITGVVMVFRDVTHQRKLRQEVEHRATHDHLTGLVNRAEFDRVLLQLFDSALKTGAEHALCCIDLDQFKIVNDSCGHVAGDQLLRQVSALLFKCVRAKDMVARLGGDEFALLLENCPPQTAQRIAQQVCERVAELRFQHGGKLFRVGASVGLVALDRRWDSARAAQQAADGACFAAKAAGRGRVHVYQEQDQSVLAQHAQMQWAPRLQQALDEDRFTLFVQPIVPLRPVAAAGLHFEVLLRLRDDDGALILPGAFMPAAERYGLATRIDRWVVTRVCQWLGGQPPGAQRIDTLAINLSGKSVGEPEFHQFIVQLLDPATVPVQQLCFEITETAAIENMGVAVGFLEMVRARGARISLDDFGSGMSSMAYLRRMPVDYLKIDGQFVKDMATDPIDCAMVRSINEIAHLMGKRTVAEFVESEAIWLLLCELGVDYAQGFHIGRPVPLEQACASPAPCQSGATVAPVR